MNTSTRLHALGAVLLLAAVPLAPALAAGDGEYAELVHERHENFEEMGDAFSVIRDQLRGDAPVDFAAQAEAAEVIRGFSTQIPDWFPAGSGPDAGYDTDALADVWENPQQFSRLAEEFVPKAAALEDAVATADLDDVEAAFRDAGGTCKSCHDSFRAD